MRWLSVSEVSEMNGVSMRTESATRRLPVILCVIMLAAVACGGWRDDGIPTGLLGTWRTDAPSYRDRGFTITPSTLTLYTGPRDSTVHAVVRTELDDGAGPAYTLVYDDNGQELRFSLVEGPEDGTGRWLHFPNQPTIGWRR